MTPADLHAAYIAGESFVSLGRAAGLDPRVVRVRILAFAHEQGLPDPRSGGSSSERDARTRRAYELRAAGQPWREVAAQLGYASSAVAVQAARRHALNERQPWPVVVDVPASRPASPARSTAKRAYELRRERLGWREIASRTGHASESGAMGSARAHAEAEGLPWPVQLDADADGEASERGRRSPGTRELERPRGEGATDAELHAAYVGGALITVLAQRHQVMPRTVHQRVLRYAQEHGLSDPRLINQRWSVPNPALLERMRRAYELRTEGMSWAEVAAGADYAGSAEAMGAARAHALDQRLPWPVRRTPAPRVDRGGRAYKLRREGHTWPEIAREMGYLTANAVQEIARRHARALGLPWPLAVRS